MTSPMTKAERLEDRLEAQGPVAVCAGPDHVRVYYRGRGGQGHAGMSAADASRLAGQWEAAGRDTKELRAAIARAALLQQQGGIEVSELLPCPFCGDDMVETQDGSIYHKHGDSDCAIIGSNHYIAKSLVPAWNRRASPPMTSTEEIRVTPDAANPNNLRIHRGGSQLCKVYGFTPEEAQAKAALIVSALSPLPEGWVAVPREPTRAMAAQGAAEALERPWPDNIAAVWKAMISARPSGESLPARDPGAAPDIDALIALLECGAQAPSQREMLACIQAALDFARCDEEALAEGRAWADPEDIERLPSREGLGSTRPGPQPVEQATSVPPLQDQGEGDALTPLERDLLHALRSVNAILTVPAAEYVPAIPEAWSVIEAAIAKAARRAGAE